MWSSSSRLSRWSLLLLAAAVVAAHAPVLAGPVVEPSPQDKEAAKDAYVEGTELREKGNTAAALEKFKLAYKLVPSPITGLAVAKALEDLGRLVEARKVYKEVDALPPKPSESPEAKSAREQAIKNAKALEGKIGRLVIIIKGLPSGVEPDELTVDGRPVAFSKVGVEVVVDPGKHVVVATSGSSGKRTVKIVAVGGQAVTALIQFEGTSEPQPEASANEPPATTTPTRTSPLVWVGGGALVVGMGLGIWGTWHHGTEVDKCDRFTAANPGSICSNSLDAQSRDRVVAYSGWGLAAVGAGLLVYGLLHPAVDEQPGKVAGTSLWVGVGPTEIRLGGRF